jgi:hypothetical protein
MHTEEEMFQAFLDHEPTDPHALRIDKLILIETDPMSFGNMWKEFSHVTEAEEHLESIRNAVAGCHGFHAHYMVFWSNGHGDELQLMIHVPVSVLTDIAAPNRISYTLWMQGAKYLGLDPNIQGEALKLFTEMKALAEDGTVEELVDTAKYWLSAVHIRDMQTIPA